MMAATAEPAPAPVLDQLSAAVQRLTTPTEIPAPPVLLAAVALGIVLIYWRPVRRIADLLVTVAHEAGHAAAAVLTGRKVTRVHVRGDGSGTTHTYGAPSGVGSFLVSFSGYPFPAAVGALLITSAVSGAARLCATLLALALAVLLLRMRNAVGWLTVALSVAGAAAAAWLSPGLWLAIGLVALGTALLGGATRSLQHERRARRQYGARTDVAQLATAGRFPAGFYWTAMLVLVLAFWAVATRQILAAYPLPW